MVSNTHPYIRPSNRFLASEPADAERSSIGLATSELRIMQQEGKTWKYTELPIWLNQAPVLETTYARHGLTKEED